MSSPELSVTPGQRLFFALWPAAATRDAMVKLQHAMPGQGARPLHPDDLHLTLAFLGSLDQAQLPCVTAAAERVRAVPFVFELARQGCWPGPRVSWLAPAEPVPMLNALVDQLWTELAGCGLRPEPRPFRAHVTCQRKVRGWQAADLPAPVAWQARDFVLATSCVGTQRPRYRILRRWPLTPP